MYRLLFVSEGQGLCLSLSSCPGALVGIQYSALDRSFSDVAGIVGARLQISKDLVAKLWLVEYRNLMASFLSVGFWRGWE